MSYVYDSHDEKIPVSMQKMTISTIVHNLIL